ncbi:unnamed protein product [Amoebophrya sp. A120]|nr:unnamed protein product [Amoebophrya sp. A120]|eukprot:GSA120T00016131001.1
MAGFGLFSLLLARAIFFPVCTDGLAIFSRTGSTSATTEEKSNQRTAACQLCTALCGQNACSAGVCPLDNYDSLNRYEASNQCWTCVAEDARQIDGFETCNAVASADNGAAVIAGTGAGNADSTKKKSLVHTASSTTSSASVTTSTTLSQQNKSSTTTKNAELEKQAAKVLESAQQASENAKQLEEAAAKQLEANQKLQKTSSGTKNARESDMLAVQAQALQKEADKAKSALDIAKKATEEVARRYLKSYEALRAQQVELDNVAGEMQAAEKNQLQLMTAWKQASAKASALANKAADLGQSAEQASLASAKATSILEAAKAARASAATATVQAQTVLARLAGGAGAGVAVPALLHTAENKYTHVGERTSSVEQDKSRNGTPVEKNVEDESDLAQAAAAVSA